MKVCLTASGGGHLIQLLKLLPILKKHRLFFIIPGSHMRATLKDYKVYTVSNPGRNLLKFVFHSVISLIILTKERPDVVITNGAGLVVPICFLSKFIFGSKIVFIESFSRINSPSMTGRIISKIADLFIIQWKDLQKFYGSKAVYGGGLV